jgi:hypothetical protein
VVVGSPVVYKSAGAVRRIEFARANRALALTADTVSTDSPIVPFRVGPPSSSAF